ncbi:MAG: hypothetical protein COA78_36000 [Blastopirellula sp.]|nr:MAG: hypothetical protein COA78_36000 [Blastopirellula sp.]
MKIILMTQGPLLRILLFSLSGLLIVQLGCGQESVDTSVTIDDEVFNTSVKKPSSYLLKITDFDASGQIETVRTEMKLDMNGRRLTNKIVDSQKHLIASERFQYDAQGKLVGRDYLTNGTTLKWQWLRVQHNNAGEPTRNDIMNSKGKNLGWYVWHYDDQGRLMRRDRFNTDKSLKFYYSDIKYDEQGDYSQWTKYDAEGAIIGTKNWEFTPR